MTKPPKKPAAKLETCPFCGEDPQVSDYKFIDDMESDPPYTLIICRGARDEHHDARVLAQNFDDAVSAWNTRKASKSKAGKG